MSHSDSSAAARVTLRVTAALAVLVGAAALAGVPSAGAAETGGGACDGVWVVVDAREVGGSQTTRCAPGDPSSGLAALEAAGHAYTFVPRVPGMVCTIDERPDPCNGAPTDAYWSYWHAEAGGSWTYASRGAGERDPTPGSVDGWAFGAGDPPGADPPEPPDDASDRGSSGGDSSGGDPSGSGSSGNGTSDGGSSSATSADGDGTASTSSADDDAASDPAPDPDAGSSSGASQAAPDPDGGAEPATDDDPGDVDDEPTDDEDEAEEDDDSDEREIDETRGNDGPAGERGDVVALSRPSDDGRGWGGVALGAGLAGALAGGAAWQVRRRRPGA